MHICNYCLLESFKSRAAKEGKIVEVKNNNVYVRYPNDQPDYRSPDDGNKQWLAWLMEIPDKCEC